MQPCALASQRCGRRLGTGLVALVLLSLLAPGRGLASGGIPDVFTMAGAYAPPEPSWAPDGKQIAFTVATAPGPVIYKVDLSTGKACAICPGELPSWSPRGDQIALLRDGDLYVVPAAGGRARRLDGPVWTDGSLLAWSDNGKQLAFQKGFRWAATSGVRKGSQLLCGELCVAEVASGKTRQLTRLKEAFPADAYQLNADVYGWLHGDRELVVSLPAGRHGPRGLYAVDLEGRGRLLCEGTVACCSISPDGTRMVGTLWERAGTHLVAADLPGTPRVLRSFTDHPPWMLVVSWPQRVAIGAGPLEHGAERTYVLTRFDLASDASRVLTSAGCYEASPALSLDGLRVAFYRHAQGKSALFVMRVDSLHATWVAACQK